MKKKWHTKIWLEEKYLDFWSLNHTLSGAVLASISILIGLPFWTSLIMSFLILLAWDIYEIFGGIKEKVGNKILDVITGLIGFFITYYLMHYRICCDNLILFLIIFFSFLILEIWGYISYRKLKK